MIVSSNDSGTSSNAEDHHQHHHHHLHPPQQHHQATNTVKGNHHHHNDEVVSSTSAMWTIPPRFRRNGHETVFPLCFHHFPFPSFFFAPSPSPLDLLRRHSFNARFPTVGRSAPFTSATFTFFTLMYPSILPVFAIFYLHLIPMLIDPHFIMKRKLERDKKCWISIKDLFTIIRWLLIWLLFFDTICYILFIKKQPMTDSSFPGAATCSFSFCYSVVVHITPCLFPSPILNNFKLFLSLQCCKRPLPRAPQFSSN